MKLPEYITRDEVRRVCKDLAIRDWTALKEPAATIEEARKILAEVNTGRMRIDEEQFRAGLDVELEHGTRFKDANVTNDHPLVTGMIVLAHMKESLDYYKLLDAAEAEGDLAAAVAEGNVERIRKYYRKLAEARAVLSETEAKLA
jgi:hypothetical protein